MDGYGVYSDGDFVSEPFLSARGDFLPSEPTVIDAVMHGDNADEGNIFRDAAASEGALDRLSTIARDILGEQAARELLDIYGLSDTASLDPSEVAWRLHRFPEDARFYLPSDKLIWVWPRAAFYHLDAKSPFASALWPKDCYHTHDLLYVNRFGVIASPAPG